MQHATNFLLKQLLFLTFLTGTIKAQITLQKNAVVPDSIAFYMLNDYAIAENANVAKFVRLITKADSGLYNIQDYYMDSQPRLITKSLNTDGLLQSGAMGPCMEYYHNGKRKSIRNYDRGKQIGDELTYYPNGKLYTIKAYLGDAVSLNTCYDSLGVLMAENGNGNWVDFDEEFLVKEEGIVINGKKDGVWRHTHNVSGNIYYDNGIVSQPDIDANFVGGHNKLDAYLKRAIKFKYQGSYNNKHGRLMMTFRVEKDGAVTDAKIVRNVDPEFDKIALESIQNMPKWSPTKFRGQPVSSIVPLTIMVSNTGYSFDSIPTQNALPARKVGF